MNPLFLPLPALALALSVAPPSEDPAPPGRELAPALAPLAPLLGGSWVGEGTWNHGGPFFARHVFEPSLGGTLVGIRSFARRDGVEIPLFETTFAAGRKGVGLHCAAAFGVAYRGAAALEPGRIELAYAGGEGVEGGEELGQVFELTGPDSYHWTSFQVRDGEREVVAEIDFTRSTWVPARTGERAVRAEVVVGAEPERVWEAWTTEEGLEGFFAPACSVDLRVGGAYEVYFDPSAPAGRRGAEGTRVLALDPPRMLAFTWISKPGMEVREQRTSVVVRLDRLAEGRTRVRLENTGYGVGSDWDEALAYFTRAWPSVLDALRERFPVAAEPARR